MRRAKNTLLILVALLTAGFVFGLGQWVAWEILESMAGAYVLTSVVCGN
jgi:hypothetical protein